MKKWQKITLYTFSGIVVLGIITFLVFVILSFVFAGQIPEGQERILIELQNEYPEHIIEAHPAFLDAYIKVTDTDGQTLSEGQVDDVRDYFNKNYDSGYWRGIIN